MEQEVPPQQTPPQQVPPQQTPPQQVPPQHLLPHQQLPPQPPVFTAATPASMAVGSGYGATVHPTPPTMAATAQLPTTAPPPPKAPKTIDELRFDYAHTRPKDVWAAVLFILQLVTAIVCCLWLGIERLRNSTEASPEASSPPSTPPPPPPANSTSTASSSPSPVEASEWLPQLAVAAAVGIIFALLWLQLLKLFPRVIIHLSLWWMVLVPTALLVTLGVYNILTPIIGIFLGLGVVLQLIFIFLVQNRIPFAAELVREASKVVRRYNGTVWVACGGLLVTVAWVVLWLFGMYGTAELSGWNKAFAIIFLLFSLYWTVEVVRNVVHTTVAGTAAAVYLRGSSMPEQATVKSLGRSMTTSFGSICFGSLIVSLLQLLRSLVHIVRGEQADNGLLNCLLSCVECILSCIEGIMRFFNKWAYIQVAIYGKGFVQAATDTFDLFRSRGLDALINDDLVGFVTSMGCFFGGALAAVAAGFLSWGKPTGLIITVCIIAFIIGFILTMQMLSVVDSAAATVYVCYAEDPDAFRRNSPHFFSSIHKRKTFLDTR